MKKILLPTIALTLLLCACHEDENVSQESYDDTFISSMGMMMDAAYITKLELYIMEKEVTALSGFDIPAIYTNEYTYKEMTPLFADYSSVKIYAVFDKHGNGLANDTTQAAIDINNLVRDWYRQRTDFILEQYKQSTRPGWPIFFTAYINGGVQLTCDKVLFGQQPGEDLSHHFKVTPPYYFLPVGREQPQVQYNFEDENQLIAGIRMTDFFTKDSWMHFSYLIRFMEEPTERYDELTFTLKFPASLEHVSDFVTSAYIGENAPMQVTDTTYTASFTAQFSWE